MGEVGMTVAHLSRPSLERAPKTKVHAFPTKDNLFARPLADTALLAHTTKLDTTPLKPRSHKKGMATPPGTDYRARGDYVPGDGDEFHQVERPGSRNHENHLSTTSTGEAFYKDGHL